MHGDQLLFFVMKNVTDIPILSFAANMAPLNAAAECPEISTAPQNPKNEVAVLASG